MFQHLIDLSGLILSTLQSQKLVNQDNQVLSLSNTAKTAFLEKNLLNASSSSSYDNLFSLRFEDAESSNIIFLWYIHCSI